MLSTRNRSAMWLNHGDAVDLDIERPGPFRHADEDAGRRIFREVTRVDRVDGREVFCRRAVDVALHHVAQRRACGLQAQFHLFEDQYGLALDRYRENLAGLRVERRQAGDKDHVTRASRAGSARSTSQDSWKSARRGWLLVSLRHPR